MNLSKTKVAIGPLRLFLVVFCSLSLGSCGTNHGFLPTKTTEKVNYDFCLPLHKLRVADGDTLEIKASRKRRRNQKRQKIRLLNIDAPEIAQEPFGENSKEHLKQLLQSSSSSQVCCRRGPKPQDKYGRTLAYCWSGKIFLNAQMIKDGQAVAYFFNEVNSQYKNSFLELEAQAEEAGLGIHSSSHKLDQLPAEFRRQNKKR